MTTFMDRNTALRELRTLVGTYLEGSDDAPRAAELLDALEPLPSLLSDTFWERLKSAVKDLADSPTAEQEDRERGMFGCTAAAIDEGLARCREPRDVAMFAMGTLSDAQELIPDRGAVSERDANTIRMRINIAKYAINMAVPR